MEKFAVITTGGKQYPVKEGDRIIVDRLHMDEGSSIELKTLLYVSNNNVKIGTPYLNDVRVMGVIKRNFKDKKILVFKKRPKKHYKKQMGFRKHLTEIEIKEIVEV